MMTTLIFDIETTGLSPLSSRITCIGVKIVGRSDSLATFCGDVESSLLQKLCEYAALHSPDSFVSYNGWSFDVPFLRVRAMVNKVKLPGIFWSDSCLSDPHHILNRNKTGKQSDYAKLFNLDSVGNGLECIAHFEKGEFGKIEAHCSSDILVLEEIFNRMKVAGFSE